MKSPTIYIRLGKMKNGKMKIEASFTQSNRALTRMKGYGKHEAIATVQFALRADLPDDAFAIPDRLIQEIIIPSKDIKPAVDVVPENNN